MSNNFDLKKYLVENKLTINSKMLNENEVQQYDWKNVMEYVIDQSIWRSREWGSRLVKGQFESFDIPFTEETVDSFFNWAQSVEGKQTLKSILKQNKEYLEWFSPDENMDEAMEEAYNPEFGLFGTEAKESELKNAAGDL